MNALEKAKNELMAATEKYNKALEYSELLKNNNDIALAEDLHTRFCRHNRTDGCGWFYESWEKVGTTRNNYLHKARILLAFIKRKNIDGETLQSLLDIVKGI